MATPTLSSHVFPTTAVSTGSGVAWTNPTNALTENASSATSALTKSATTSQTLRVTGFDFSFIPAGALITGVEVRIKRSTAGNTVTDNSVVGDHAVIMGRIRGITRVGAHRPLLYGLRRYATWRDAVAGSAVYYEYDFIS